MKWNVQDPTPFTSHFPQPPLSQRTGWANECPQIFAPVCTGAERYVSSSPPLPLTHVRIRHSNGSRRDSAPHSHRGLQMGKSPLPSPSYSPEHPHEDRTRERNVLSPPRSPATQARKGSLRPHFPLAPTHMRIQHVNEQGRILLAREAWTGTLPFPPFCASFSSTHARTESANRILPPFAWGTTPLLPSLQPHSCENKTCKWNAQGPHPFLHRGCRKLEDLCI